MKLLVAIRNFPNVPKGKLVTVCSETRTNYTKRTLCAERRISEYLTI